MRRQAPAPMPPPLGRPPSGYGFAVDVKYDGSTSRGLIVVDDDGVAVFTRNGENMTACSGTTSPMIDPVLVWGESMVDAP